LKKQIVEEDKNFKKFVRDILNGGGRLLPVLLLYS
jgi:hypothetical protein